MNNKPYIVLALPNQFRWKIVVPNCLSEDSAKSKKSISSRIMPVAVHLVEVLALITALGIIVAFTFFVVAADRILFLALVIVRPMSTIFSWMMYKSEQILLWVLNRILLVVSSVGDTFEDSCGS